ncbi:MAG: Gx transporter family protein [Bacillota bacterium]|nr:Gx transporter family protein [Bacillota bacterium]
MSNSKSFKSALSPQKIAIIAVLISMALVLSVVERMFPPIVPVPGIKIGLPNIMTLFAIFYLDTLSAFIIVVLRCIIAAGFFGGVTVFAFSLAGGLCALLIMRLLKSLQNRYVSYIGISIAGAASHNLGQVLVASFFLQSFNIFAYLPLLLLGSIVTGIITGSLYAMVDGKLMHIPYFKGIKEHYL